MDPVRVPSDVGMSEASAVGFESRKKETAVPGVNPVPVTKTESPTKPLFALRVNVDIEVTVKYLVTLFNPAVAVMP